MGSIIGLLAGTLLGSVTGVQSASNGLNYSINRTFPNTIIQQNDIVDLYRRGYLTKFAFYEMMRFHGFNEIQARLAFLASASLITPEQALTYRIDQSLRIEYAREINVSSEGANGISESQYDQALIDNETAYFLNMRKLGYNKSEAQKHFLSNRPLPSFSYMLEWLAKEVFEPDQIKEFELDDTPPPEMYRYFEKYGVPKEEADKYWISHWNTIGFGQWREIYNRFNSRRSSTHVNEQLDEFNLDHTDVVVTDQAYRNYFKVLELTPYFADRLLGITSEPLNFTTLQDLYRYGVLNQTAVLEYLKDYNYSNINASRIVDAWKRKYPLGDRLPLSDNVLYQYKVGAVTRNDAESALRQMGADTVTIKYQLDKILDKITEDRLMKRVKYLAIRYGRKLISSTELDTEIARLTNDEERQEFMRIDILIESEKYIRRPSIRQIGRGYKDGKLTLEETTTALRSYRMPADDIIVLLKIEAPDIEITPQLRQGLVNNEKSIEE